MTIFLAWWLIFSRSTPICSKIEDWRSFEVMWPRNWRSFQNVLTYTCEVFFPRFFGAENSNLGSNWCFEVDWGHWRRPMTSRPPKWRSFQNTPSHTCGVSFPSVFRNGEFEFGVKLMLISQLRSLTSSNDLQSSILLKIGVDLLKISHHAKNLTNLSKNVEDMAITNMVQKCRNLPPPLI